MEVRNLLDMYWSCDVVWIVENHHSYHRPLCEEEEKDESQQGEENFRKFDYFVLLGPETFTLESYWRRFKKINIGFNNIIGNCDITLLVLYPLMF